MSIAEKLVTIAENTPKVCNAVQSAKREVNGNVVVAHDISTIEHPLEVKLTKDSETPTDFSSVTVKQNGKNQADIEKWSYLGENCTSSETVKEGDSITAKGFAGSALAHSSGFLHLRLWNKNTEMFSVASANQTVTVTLYVTLLEQGVHDNRVGFYVVNGSSTTGSGGRADVALTLGERTKVSFTRTPTFDLTGLGVRMNNNKIKVEMDTLQIEYGYEATEFEAYKEPITYTANADGTVDGVMSLAPSMTLVSSDPEATINCRYFPVEAVGVRTAYAELVDAETALRDRLRQGG